MKGPTKGRIFLPIGKNSVLRKEKNGRAEDRRVLVARGRGSKQRGEEREDLSRRVRRKRGTLASFVAGERDRYDRRGNGFKQVIGSVGARGKKKETIAERKKRTQQRILIKKLELTEE